MPNIVWLTRQQKDVWKLNVVVGFFPEVSLIYFSFWLVGFVQGCLINWQKSFFDQSEAEAEFHTDGQERMSVRRSITLY